MRYIYSERFTYLLTENRYEYDTCGRHAPAAVLNTVSDISKQDVIEFLHDDLHADERLLLVYTRYTVRLTPAGYSRARTMGNVGIIVGGIEQTKAEPDKAGFRFKFLKLQEHQVTYSISRNQSDTEALVAVQCVRTKWI